MIHNRRTGELYGNRKEAKMRLGGLGAYNELLKRGELLFIDNGSLIDNILNQKLSYEKER